jgi:hypothetical protein
MVSTLNSISAISSTEENGSVGIFFISTVEQGQDLDDTEEIIVEDVLAMFLGEGLKPEFAFG